ncbi:alginate lyase family protein, partial [Streptomyces sp. GbtcB7]|uniref:alginate lyase family protein n=1 Tax=Streptomyces sp. GbtcB7 TaxID=2824752 RepID=UPI001C2F7C93
LGGEGGATKNHHGTLHAMQHPPLGYATGGEDPARRTVPGAESKRIDPQVAAHGSQPQELTRPRSWHYSTFDLVAYTR